MSKFLLGRASVVAGFIGSFWNFLTCLFADSYEFAQGIFHRLPSFLLVSPRSLSSILPMMYIVPSFESIQPFLGWRLAFCRSLLERASLESRNSVFDNESRLKSGDLNSSRLRVLKCLLDDRNFSFRKTKISGSVLDDRYTVSNGGGYVILISWDENTVLNRDLDTPYPMEVDTLIQLLSRYNATCLLNMVPIKKVTKTPSGYGMGRLPDVVVVVWKSVRYGVSKGLDTTYWGFLGVSASTDTAYLPLWIWRIGLQNSNLQYIFI
ncbi:hypothetical protein Tco_1375526 [Tanacetum coccineum]